ncbi:MAG TPA: hypothetical protein VFE53_01690 [Mucilaginibacter sp.]|jgi:hypothetical protein|nr:hypothetical protein [Mucilaginibacter sp.]
MKTLTLAIILMAVSTFCLAQNNPPPPTQGPPPTIDELRVGGPVDGLGKRTALISLVHLADSAIVFKQVADVNGLPDFYATDKYNTSVEITGKEDSLVMIQWTFRMIFNNGAATHEEIGRMGYFAGLIGGKEGYDWFSNIYLNFKDKPLSDYTETKQLF